jgi:hypothetical protein
LRPLARKGAKKATCVLDTGYDELLGRRVGDSKPETLRHRWVALGLWDLNEEGARCEMRDQKLHAYVLDRFPDIFEGELGASECAEAGDELGL